MEGIVWDVQDILEEEKHMLAIVIGAAADSKVLFFIALIICTLLVYIICSKIEDAIYHAADKTHEIIENKISGSSERSSIPSSKEVEVPQKTKATQVQTK